MKMVSFSYLIRLTTAAVVSITLISADDSNEFKQTTQMEEETGVSNALYDTCRTEDQEFVHGACMLSQECDLINGTASGSCAQGLGTCCIVKKTCNSWTSLNNTYFVNDDSKWEGGCTYTVNRATDDICQVRLDFIEFELSQPNNDGHCLADFFTATGEMVSDFPILCGHNSGQHMYIDVLPNGGALDLIIDLSSQPIPSRSWKIQVQQIACGSKHRAPEGCLQYFLESAGSIKSFNFNADKEYDEGTQQLSNHEYSICIKRAPGYCQILWERDLQQSHSFTISADADVVPADLLGSPGLCGKGSDECTTDYVIIPGGDDHTGRQSDRYCGLGFPTSVTSTSIPFILRVKTDDNEISDGGNQGFHLYYRQNDDC